MGRPACVPRHAKRRQLLREHGQRALQLQLCQAKRQPQLLASWGAESGEKAASAAEAPSARMRAVAAAGTQGIVEYEVTIDAPGGPCAVAQTAELMNDEDGIEPGLEDAHALETLHAMVNCIQMPKVRLEVGSRPEPGEIR